MRPCNLVVPAFLRRVPGDPEKATDLDPSFAPAHSNRGNVFYALGKFDQALADYGKAIELSPEFAAAYNNRGNVYDDLGNIDQALLSDGWRTITLGSGGLISPDRVR